MSDDELVNHLLEAAGSITKAAASAAQVVEGIERHRRARKSQGRGLSARDRGILADCQKSVRDLLAAARGLQAFARSILAADGPEATAKWCEGLVANMARPPEGGGEVVAQFAYSEALHVYTSVHALGCRRQRRRL